MENKTDLSMRLDIDPEEVNEAENKHHPHLCLAASRKKWLKASLVSWRWGFVWKWDQQDLMVNLLFLMTYFVNYMSNMIVWYLVSYYWFWLVDVQILRMTCEIDLRYFYWIEGVYQRANQKVSILMMCGTRSCFVGVFRT